MTLDNLRRWREVQNRLKRQETRRAIQRRERLRILLWFLGLGAVAATARFWDAILDFLTRLL